MAGIDNALGISPQVLAIRAQRMNLLSANIANADTPNYKAQDVDFASAMRTATNAREPMTARHERHFAIGNEAAAANVQYRSPDQLSLNGNTVEPHKEHAAFIPL